MTNHILHHTLSYNEGSFKMKNVDSLFGKMSDGWHAAVKGRKESQDYQ
jgi:hypothetical protein